MIVDTHAYIGCWPFRRPPWSETADIVKKLKSLNITEAWTGSFEGVYHKDLAGVNIRLAAQCKRHTGFLIPFGSVNPRQLDWEEDLRRCHEDHGMPGIRLHPNYHGYKLDEPIFARCLGKAAERKMIVQIVVRMEDERTQHPLMQVPPVNVRPLLRVAASVPDLRVEILNGNFGPRDEETLELARTAKIYCDFANTESVGGLGKLIERMGRERVLFGTHFPLFYAESALFKVRESALADEVAQAIYRGNARLLLPRA